MGRNLEATGCTDCSGASANTGQYVGNEGGFSVDTYMAPIWRVEDTPHPSFAGPEVKRDPYAIVEINSVFESRQIWNPV